MLHQKVAHIDGYGLFQPDDREHPPRLSVTMDEASGQLVIITNDVILDPPRPSAQCFPINSANDEEQKDG